MKRTIILGGRGHFGRTLAEQLRMRNVSPLVAARNGVADLQLDADDHASLRRNLQADDLVLDAAGPYHRRSMALVDAAIEIGFDVIDLNDDLGYAEQMLVRVERIAAARIRVLTSASSVSAVSAAMVRQSGFLEPVSVLVWLAPASRFTANRGTALSLIRSVGKPIRTWRDGVLQAERGWSQSRSFHMPPPLGKINGRLFESADAIWLPRSWPSLRQVEMFVDTNTLGVNNLLRLAASSGSVRMLLVRIAGIAVWLSKRVGSSAGGLGFEIADVGGKIARFAIHSGQNSYITAVAPAVLAASAILENRFPEVGLIPPERHCQPAELVEFLQSAGIKVESVAG
ncbi:MAG TPA: hypothetical protein VGJ15_03160 [Pirellulales bacterium]